MTRFDGGKDFRMRQIGTLGVSGGRVSIEHKRVACFHGHKAAGKSTETKLWALQVDEHPDRPARVTLDGADHANQLAHAVLGGMARINTKNVGARLEQLRNHVGIRGCGPESSDDFRAAQTPHGLAPPAGGGDSTVGGREVPSGARGANGRSGACSAVSVNCTVQERCSVVSTSKKPVRS